MTQPTASTGAEFCGRIHGDIAAIWCDVGHTLTPDRAAQRQAAE